MPSLPILKTSADIAQFRQAVLTDNQPLVLVPTMGNLHAGHMTLIEQAKAISPHVIVSIFVNPTQFGPNEDLARYPRTFEEDCEKMLAHEVSAVFYPDVETMYPNGLEHTLSIDVVGDLTKILCAKQRPTHFQGVATVVSKLFQLISPDVAIFGQKDYQQLAVIRRLVSELFFPIRIVSAPIVREDNGLAMSSRNQYLSEDERHLAGQIYKTLQATRQAIENGELPSHAIDAGVKTLTKLGMTVEFLEYRDAQALTKDLTNDATGNLSHDHSNGILLIAARLGKTRLIDNLLMREN